MVPGDPGGHSISMQKLQSGDVYSAGQTNPFTRGILYFFWFENRLSSRERNRR